jgi:hypothetical protein
MTNHEQALDQAVMKLLATVAVGRHEGRPNVAIMDAVEEQLPELRRLRGEVVLEKLEQEMKPRKVRRMSPERRQRRELRLALGLDA